MKNSPLILAVFVLIAALSVQLAEAGGINHAPRIHAKDGTSTNWSGYAVQTSLTSPASGAVSAVSGSWTVPAANCAITPGAYSSFWVGIDGYSSSTVEQTGTDSDCSSGNPRYYAWYEMYPKSPVNLAMNVSPGDVMSASVTYVGSGSFQVAISDMTTRSTFTATLQSKKAKRSSAEWIAEAPSSVFGVLPLADFGTVSFTGSNATINGHSGPISDSAWQNDRIVMASGSTVKAVPSALSTDGSAFTVAWQHS